MLAGGFVGVDYAVEVLKGLDFLRGDGGRVDECQACETGIQEGEDLGVVGGIGRVGAGERVGCGDGGGAELAAREQRGDWRVSCGLLVGVAAEGGRDGEWGERVVDLGAEQEGEVFGPRGWDARARDGGLRC